MKFSEIEDQDLQEYVKIYGENQWSMISSFMNGRNSRQCHDRWTYYLNPRLNKSPWSFEEDMLLIYKVNEFGAKWVKISRFFHGRTDIDIKNRWNKISRKVENSLEKKQQLNSNDSSTTPHIDPISEYFDRFLKKENVHELSWSNPSINHLVQTTLFNEWEFGQF